SRTVHTEVSQLLRAMLLCGLAFSVALVAFRLVYVSRPFIVIFLIANAVLVAIGRGLVRAVILDNTVRRRVLVAGGRAEVMRAAASVDAHSDWGLEVVGVIGDGTWNAEAALPYTFLGRYEDIPRLVQGETVVDEVLIAPAAGRLDELRALEGLFLDLEEQGVVTRLVVNFLPQSLSDVSFDEFGGIPMLTFSTAPRDELLLFARRCADFVLASLLLAVLSPVFAIIGA